MRWKTPILEGVNTNIFSLSAGATLLVLLILCSFPECFAHLEHLPHYNGNGVGVGKYYVNQAIDPEYTPPQEPSKISFSIQDGNGNDVYNILTMVEIYAEKSGDRLKVYPWTQRDSGDFSIYYTFPDIGNYQVVLSIANKEDPISHNRIDPARNALTNNLNCNCDRGVFNISVTKNFGNIYGIAILAGVLGIIVVLGVVLGWIYRSRMKSHLYMNLTNNKEGVKYLVLLFAIGAGCVHLAVYSEHGSVRIEYSIFLLAAAGSQVGYGILYVLLSLTDESKTSQSRTYTLNYYRKTVILNLFGLIGSMLLIVLYIYSVVLPPPLSPNNRPENVDFGGILDKSFEFLLVIGIVYLMVWEKRRLQSQQISVE
jgi:hypothetical protein